jgi:hypothetical protein
VELVPFPIHLNHDAPPLLDPFQRAPGGARTLAGRHPSNRVGDVTGMAPAGDRRRRPC